MLRPHLAGYVDAAYACQMGFCISQAAAYFEKEFYKYAPVLLLRIQ